MHSKRKKRYAKVTGVGRNELEGNSVAEYQGY